MSDVCTICGETHRAFDGQPLSDYRIERSHREIERREFARIHGIRIRYIVEPLEGGTFGPGYRSSRIHESADVLRRLEAAGLELDAVEREVLAESDWHTANGNPPAPQDAIDEWANEAYDERRLGAWR